MSSLGWMIVAATARWLEPAEQEAVLGDLAECGQGFFRNWLDVAGLLTRRQMRLWMGWRPWFAAAGLAMPCSFLLIGYSLSVSEVFVRLFDSPLEWVGTGEFAHGIWQLVYRLVLLMVVAWTGGFLVGTISRKTLYASAIACLVPCFYCLSRFGVHSESRYCLLLYVLPALWGVWQGFRGYRISLRWALVMAITATLLAVPGARGPGILVLAALLTVWSSVALAWPRPAKT